MRNPIYYIKLYYTPKEVIEKGIAGVVIILLALLVLTSVPLEYKNSLDSTIALRILENIRDEGDVNLVTAVLLDFRAYDTFGEVLVLYVAITGVVVLKRGFERGEEGSEEEEGTNTDENSATPETRSENQEKASGIGSSDGFRES